MTVEQIWNTLTGCLSELSQSPQLFLKNPTKDFTRNRKLSFYDTVALLLSMEGKSTGNELLEYFHCSMNTPSASALRQQRDKILPEAFEFLFRTFTSACMGDCSLYKGHRLLAVDGADLSVAANPSDPDSYYPGTNGQSHYNIFHLNALYDLKQKVYVDALVQKSRTKQERKALCDMVDRSDIQDAIVLADRGYESYNVLAHIQEKGWKYLIRVKNGTRGICSALALPLSGEFDLPFHLKLSNKRTNKVKELYQDKCQYKYIDNRKAFDFLPKKNRKHEPATFYSLPFRVVRFQISDNTYETLFTNLDFPPDELKQLYAMRWGIETSFRYLKYTIGLSFLHSKKPEFIMQEIFSRLTTYNFSQLITTCVVRQEKTRKYAYQVNFSAAVHLCRQLLRGNLEPPVLQILIARLISPVRPNRSSPRKLTAKGFVGFTYRVA